MKNATRHVLNAMKKLAVKIAAVIVHVQVNPVLAQGVAERIAVNKVVPFEDLRVRNPFVEPGDSRRSKRKSRICCMSLRSRFFNVRRNLYS
jgi:hypothetical protein